MFNHFDHVLYARLQVVGRRILDSDTSFLFANENVLYDFRAPLHYACDIDSINQVKQLLEKGANTSMKDAKGRKYMIVLKTLYTSTSL